jgi:hypothetical protein
MSRVEGDRQQAREAERLQKAVEKQTRETQSSAAGREAFGQLLSKSGEAAKEGARQAAEQSNQQPTAKSDAQKSAMLARNGLAQQSKVMEQAKGFQGSLEQAQQKSASTDQGRVQGRDAGVKKDRVEHEERREVLEQKAESKKDRDADVARADTAAAAKPNAAIGSDGGSKGDQEPPKDDGSAAAAAAAKKAAQQPQAVQGAKKAHEVKHIPPELLEKLVSTVHLAVTEKGLKEFQIEMKDGPLKGASLKISAENGKIALSFSGLGASEKNLLEASKGDLMRRLEKKGLTLGRLELK